MTRALGDVGDFGKCSLRLELAGRQFVTRAGSSRPTARQSQAHSCSRSI